MFSLITSITRSKMWTARIILVFLLLTPLTTFSAPQYTVAPFVIDQKVLRRDIITETILVKNVGTQSISLFPIVNTVSIGLDGGVEEFVSASMSDRTTSVTSWIEISRKTINLVEGESREIPITFRINPNAEPGLYHAYIAFANGRNIVVAEENVRNGRAKGVIINITVEDESFEILRLSKFLIDRFIFSPGIDDIKYTVDNPGDTEITPQGDIILYNPRGEEVGSVEINPERKTVRPGESIVFSAGIPTTGLLGKYKAFLTLEYGTKQRASVNDTAFFYVFPWKKLSIFFAIFVVLALFISLWVHKRYLAREDDLDDDVDHLPVSIKESISDPKSHDIDMK